MGGPGLQVARAKSSIAGIGGGDGRPKAHSGPGLPALTKKFRSCSIVTSRLSTGLQPDTAHQSDIARQDGAALTIEPDGSVSMCQLQSTDMDAPDLVTQVVNRVKTINFGPKDGVQAVTISYPIDFLPAT